MNLSADDLANAAADSFSAGNDALALQQALQGLSLDPQHRNCRINAACSHQRLGQFSEALQFYRQLIVDGQEDAAVLGNLAQLQVDQNLHALALGTLEVALKQRNGVDARLHFLKGVALSGLQRPREAIAAFRNAVMIDASLLEAHHNLAKLLHEQGLLMEAFDAFGEAIQRWPQNAEFLYGLGNLLFDADLLSHSKQFLLSALTLEPSHRRASFNLGLASLKAGEFSEGWRFYEHRFCLEMNRLVPHASPPGPRLENLFPLPTQLLVVSEQGLGDTLQFIRYLPLLAARCPSTHLIVAVQGPVLEICQGALPGFQVVEVFKELKAAPQIPWVPLLSLPQLLGLSTPSQLEVPMPYLSVPDARVDAWALRIRPASGFKLALHWQGNPRAERSNLAGRSLPLEILAPLMALPGLTLISIQKGEAADQRLSCSFAERFIACQDAIDATWDFLDIAAILRCCDLLITTDSAAAHLAGGLGVPTWLLLHHPSDWRWGQHHKHTHWYPSMQLFRQPAPGRWDAVVESLIEPLLALLSPSAALPIQQ